ncbi:MAG: RsmB/NOP family class I SAM-dependent RNA methyltransferase [Oscillospiraceae bacterium]|nr:RsmB/NOP family class I SAM-dependent RNA methyltransferase [Oscillospiraceae bacterium]
MLPNGFTQRMQALLGEEYEAFLASYEHPRNTGLRLNPLKSKPLDLPFCADRILWEENGFYLTEGSRPGLHPYHDAGLYYLQEPSAMAPARLLAPQPGERVLDLCAAPGGKSTQIAAMLKGEGLLVCNEIHPKRARILSSNIERMGIQNALVLNEHPAKLAQRFAGYFDRILVDAPCSGEGMFRKEEAAISDWSPETVRMCAARQKEILSSASQMLRPGGTLVYSTCTFSPEENEGVISDFLKEHEGFCVEKVSAPWFDRGKPEWIEDPVQNLEYCFRLWPHKLKGEGHFAAVLKRIDGEVRTQSCAPTESMPREIRKFLEENRIPLSGGVISFGNTSFLAPSELPDLGGLKVLRAGLELGQLRSGHFLPAHALALWLRDFPQKEDFSPAGSAIAAYLRGETLFSSQRGWVLVTVDSVSLGWAKGADGILKNHYPKGLRRV